MTTNNTIEEKLDLINRSIKLCAAEIGRSDSEIRLIAVSKFIDEERILAAYQAGQRRFGENRVQEIQKKKDLLPSDIEWHMIGRLQTNKVRMAVKASHLIHSVDSFRLLNKINGAAEEIGKKQDILIQTNISGEISKSGVSLEVCEELLTETLEMHWVSCKGFMAIPPLAASENELGLIFNKLRCFRDKMETKLKISLPELSMGMSGDYKIAIREGATLVRIGTAIFGSRRI